MTTSAPPAQATNAELIGWAFEALNRRDSGPLRHFWTDATVERFPDATCHGADAIAAYFDAVFAALPDFHMEVVSLVAQGDDVFVQWHLTGTHSGADFSGIAPTGRALALDGMDHFVLRDGKVVSNFVVYDQMQFARQIGMLPPDGSGPDKGMKAAFNAKTKLASRLRQKR